MEEDFDREIKVVVLGNGGVGKTSMIRRFCKGVFTDEYKKTIGVDFLEKAQFVDALQEEVRFMLWDTAGQEEFDAITRTYYRGAGAAVIAFSTTDLDSFKAVSGWKDKIIAECGDIAMCLVQNKVDLIDRAVVSPEDVEAMARQLGLKLYRTCVKENINVTEVFGYLAELHHKKLQTGQLSQQPAAAAITAPPGSAAAAAAAAAAPPPPPIQQAQGGPEPVADAAPQREGPVTVNLQPSKVRTKGKKSLKAKLTACSIA
ncbi:Rab23 [Gonium pectorale]|uniref:Rab23 n=1 Tax=Gonium pectorale TaxID=33097 RepID=A0A150GR51_GONPE|nr:Rab23 [Gonium pectorale]|eukprot:KXZ52218.1 Rab23 [Gonium pectorale]